MYQILRSAILLTRCFQKVAFVFMNHICVSYMWQGFVSIETRISAREKNRNINKMLKETDEQKGPFCFHLHFTSSKVINTFKIFRKCNFLPFQLLLHSKSCKPIQRHEGTEHTEQQFYPRTKGPCFIRIARFFKR